MEGNVAKAANCVSWGCKELLTLQMWVRNWNLFGFCRPSEISKEKAPLGRVLSVLFPNGKLRANKGSLKVPL